MTWEEAVQKIRKDPDQRELVLFAYLDSDIESNVIRFFKSEEFYEVIEIIKSYAPEARTILDIGAGNGISTVSFAQIGYNVVAIEPDPSPTVGAGAIRKLKEEFHLENIEILQTTGESLNLESQFDVIYARQVMHHADHLIDFIKNLYIHCKPGGLLLTTRDHVVYSKKDKEDFLKHHPLHRYYGGENAYTLQEYTSALKMAGFKIQNILRHYDSVINYAPLTKLQYEKLPETIDEGIKDKFRKYKLPYNQFFISFYKGVRGLHNPYNERKVMGRLYSFICIKEC